MMDISFERRLQNQGYRSILGSDEVGLGSIALDFVVCAVVIDDLDKARKISIDNKLFINDSKKFNPDTQIPKMYDAIIESGVVKDSQYSVVQVNEINTIKNMKRVQQLGFDRAIEPLLSKCDIVITGDVIPSIDLKDKPLHSLIKADKKCVSVAIASCLAKHFRDNICRGMAQLYPHYDWDLNKAYATKHHIKAMVQHGLTPMHRVYYSICQEVLRQRNES